MKRIIMLFLVLSASSIASMEIETSELCGPNNKELVRLASLAKNKIYDLKTELNYVDKSGNISMMHLQLFDSSKNQTQKGMFLECIKNIPCALHLPYGRWQFARPFNDSGDHVKKLLAKLMTEFELQLESYTLVQTLGEEAVVPVSVYAIQRIGQVVLEKGAYKGETGYMDAIHAEAAWKAIFTE